MKIILHLAIFACSAFVAAAEMYLSPVDLDVLGESRLFVTCGTGKRLLEMDAESLEVTRQIDFPAELTATAISADGSTFYVTGGVADGKVFIVDAASWKITHTIAAGHSPMAPVLSADGAKLYVCNRFSNEVSVFDTRSRKLISQIPVGREPVSADLSADGTILFVANHLPEGRADTDYTAAEISAIDLGREEVATIPLVNGAGGLRGIKVSPDGKFVLATHYVARFQVPLTQLERGWASTDAVSVIRVADRALLHTVLLDDLMLDFPTPWALDFSANGKKVIVSAAGSQEIGVVDFPKLIEKAEREAEAGRSMQVSNDLSFASGIRKRVTLKGNGPRSLLVSGRKAYVGGYFSDSVEVVEFSGDPGGEHRIQALTSGHTPDMARRGEMLFNDARLSLQQWMSCATCHPDGRSDALNWDRSYDGIGNPKNVKSVLNADRIAPTTWMGLLDDSHASVRSALRKTLFSAAPEEDARALDAYIASLQPVPSPYLENGEPSVSARRGKLLFEELRCAGCHSGELFTDGNPEDVGTTGAGVDQDMEVVTPALTELWRNAPYLHDGRAATVREIITTDSHADMKKRAGNLEETQIDDLTEYLLSL
ncbi:cytochrome c peroxidase [Luteolibacter algae]|uniref:Cytochrome c peroxidase n=1 Tax=Luteolibacter algae TaxID=454151 RepID=A0ABW5D481_9BACT